MGRREGLGHKVAAGAGPSQFQGWGDSPTLQLGLPDTHAPRLLLQRGVQMLVTGSKVPHTLKTHRPEAGQAIPLPLCVPHFSPPAPKLDSQQEGNTAPKRIIQWLLGEKNRYCVGSFHQTTA